MKVVQLPITTEKTIFTARTEDGFVGCVRKDEFVCVTLNVYDSALKAANGARSLEAKLRSAPTKTEPQKDKKIKITSKKKKKKVACAQKLFTLSETQAMPFLSFQEVWVITKGECYVRDYLNQETKKLVTYTKDKDQACYFKDHDKAKMAMRVLKGVVGPGFDLYRFFIHT